MEDSATVLVNNALTAVYRFAGQLEAQAQWVDADLDAAMWECVALLCAMGRNLEVAQGFLLVGADSSDQVVGSVLEDGLVGRGLLYRSLALGILMGVIGSEEEIDEYQSLLNTRTLKPVEIIVAYLDYLGTTDIVGEDFTEIFAGFAWEFAAGLPRYRWRSRYWTFSDTYSIFGILAPDGLSAQVGAFVKDLIYVQEKMRAREAHDGWRWEIGVTIAEAIVLGDLLIPSRSSVRAASLMKIAHAPDKGGGLILVDPLVVTRAGASCLSDVIDSGLSVTVTRKEVRKVDVFEVRNRSQAGDN